MKICVTMKKFPGNMTVIPLLIGCLVDTFILQVLEIGGFTTSLFRTGAFAPVGLFILCGGATIDFKQAALPLYKGAMLTILKYAIGVSLGLGLNRLFGPMEILSLTPLAVITAATNSNGATYTTLAKGFGDNTDVGAIVIPSLNDGSFLTMATLGITGLAETPILSLIVVIVSLAIGMVLSNLDEDFKTLLSNELVMPLPSNGFVLGANTSLFTTAKAGADDIILRLMTVLLTGALTYYLYSLIRRKPDPMRMAIGTTGDNAVAAPTSVAIAGPSLEPVVGAATAQVVGAVAIIVILTPILTGFFARRAAKRQQKN